MEKSDFSKKFHIVVSLVRTTCCSGDIYEYPKIIAHDWAIWVK